jgi:uncharacterized protein YaaW (UPF0174 family)
VASKEPIFEQLPESVLQQIATYLAWDPVVTETPLKLLSQLEEEEKLIWLNAHRANLEQHVSWVGTPVFSYALGNRKTYREVVTDLAEQLKVKFPAADATAEIEARIVEKVWRDTLSRMAPDQREELLSRANALAQKQGKSLRKEAGALAALTTAQLSGFGIYLAASTLLGAINSALGLGLSFGVFTGLSSLISVLIGPIGWAGLGLFTIHKLGAPNYKKLLPVVILVAAERTTPNSSDTGETPGDSPTPQSPAAIALTPTSVLPSDETKKVIKHIEEFVREEAKRVKPPTQRSPGKATKSDKTIWDISPETQSLRRFLKEQNLLDPRLHFLDHSPADQKALRELHREEVERETESERLKAEAEEAKHRERVQQARDASRRQRDIEKWRDRHARLLPNLEFHTKAIERLIDFDFGHAVFEHLGRMNLGKLVYRNSIHGTQPKVYELKAGYDYRIYCRPDGQRKTIVLLVGDKGTQQSDIAILQQM